MPLLPAIRTRLGALVKSQPNPQMPAEVAASIDNQGLNWASPYSPGQPLQPFSGYGGLPKAWNVPAGYNIVSRPQRDSRVSFEVLKQLTDSYDIARMCIGHRIDDVRSLGYAVATKKGFRGDDDAVIAEAERILEYPEGPGGTLPFHAWLAKYLEDVLRYDAGCLYRRRDRAGRVIGLKVVSGITIAPVLDYWGDTPLPPAPAYVQFYQGQPWKWLTTKDIIYVPFRPQSDSPYGFAPLEAVLLNANTDLRFQMHFLNWFTQGTVPEGFAMAPEDISTKDQLADWQGYWDALLYGDDAAKHQIKFMPFGTKFEWPKDKPFDEKFPLYLMRKTAAAFHITPNDLGWTETVNRATADTQVDVQFRIGTLPLVEHVECIINSYLQVDRGLPVEFSFDTGQEKEDRLAEAQTWGVYVQNGAASPDEMRRELTGLPIDPARPTPRVLISQRLGAVPLLALEGVAGKIDPETFGPAADQPALDQPFVPPIGVVPHPGTTDDQASIAALDAYQVQVRQQLESEQGGTSARESEQDRDARGTRQAVPTGGQPLKQAPQQQAAAAAQQPAAPAGQQPPQPAQQRPKDEPELQPAAKSVTLSGAEASELAAFRRFVDKRRDWGRWTHDFEFSAVDPATAANLNAGARAEVLAKAAGADHIARAVYEQLLSDFPAQDVTWVLGLRWTGPEFVPLDQIDWSNQESWTASHQPEKVAKYARKIQKGKIKPGILIARPGKPTVMIADGHHHALAEKQLHRPVYGYIAHPTTVTGPWDELHSYQQHDGDGGKKGKRGKGKLAKAGTQQPAAPDTGRSAPKATESPVAAGIAVHAADSGRILMLQRALADDDPAAGTWEFPGGKLEDGETPAQGAVREWAEETGCVLPEGQLTGTWTSPNGAYQGFVWQVPSETDVPIDAGRDEVTNPDDPDGDQFEALAWWDPSTLDGNPVVRPELAADVPQLHRILGTQPSDAAAASQDAAAAEGDAQQPIAKAATLSKAQANYRDPSDLPGRNCVTCTMYRHPGSCTLVKGAIDPAAICDHWEVGDGGLLSKAGDDPKAPARSVREDWPGWRLDLAAADYWAPRISAALLAAVDVPALVAEYLAAFPPGTGTSNQQDQDAEQRLILAWLIARNVRVLLYEALRPILLDAYTDGYLIGASAAFAKVDGALEADVGAWTPGATDIARQLLGERGDGAGLVRLLAAQDITIRSIAETRVETLGRLLADATERGLSLEDLIEEVRALLTRPDKARTIAITEITRASSAAAMEVYRARGVHSTRWATKEDAHVDHICEANEAQGPVPIGTPFESGDLFPPAHPECRCACVPVRRNQEA
jgi:SPP1 gp7 family putative phage head morphogenesis protein